jgi:hypothetical protein
MTVVFTIISPVFHFLSLNTSFSSILFTIVAGTLLTAGLFALGIFAKGRLANFAVAFLAVQCLLNAALDLVNVFFINAPLIGSDIQTDAGNMSAATGLPGIVWVVIWMGISLVMISLGLRLYAVKANKASADDSVFESDASV